MFCLTDSFVWDACSFLPTQLYRGITDDKKKTPVYIWSVKCDDLIYIAKWWLQSNTSVPSHGHSVCVVTFKFSVSIFQVCNTIFIGFTILYIRSSELVPLTTESFYTLINISPYSPSYPHPSGNHHFLWF